MPTEKLTKMKMAGKIEGKQVHQEIFLDGEFNKLCTKVRELGFEARTG